MPLGACVPTGFAICTVASGCCQDDEPVAAPIILEPILTLDVVLVVLLQGPIPNVVVGLGVEEDYVVDITPPARGSVREGALPTRSPGRSPQYAI
jgi:hypothetical protein